MSFSDPIQPIEPSTDKYWITDLNTSSLKSPFAVKFTLIKQPEKLEEMRKWITDTYKGGCKYKEINGLFFAEIFFRSELDATMFVLMWRESFN